tara:strand:- start:403 stop:636 length:234 start_codon:yes stop_codon:yes gene_type:complete
VQNRQIPQRRLPQSQRPKLPLPKPNRPRIKARMTDTVLAEVILRHRLFWPNFSENHEHAGNARFPFHKGLMPCSTAG